MSDSTAKKRLREQKLKEHEKAWMSRSGSVLQPASTNRIIGSGKRKAMVDYGDEGPPNKMKHSQSRLVLDDSEGGGMDSVDSSLFMPSIGEDGDLASRIDPRLLNTTDSLQGAIAGDGNKDDVETSTEIQEMFLNQLGAELGIPLALQLPDLEYIKFLSRVNIITRSQSGPADDPVVPDWFHGNGRDPPTLFQNENDCEDHTLYKSSAEYRQHLRVAHPLWLPRKCPLEDCALTTEFTSKNGLRVHLAVGHEIKDKLVLKTYSNRRVRTFLVNQRCSYHGGTHATSFKQKKTLLHHLRKNHQVSDEDLESYIQRVED
ncbi:hypothetical protein DL98DRAFT_598571 [Cadophora sp. DSE1049]|nr:hypothetical protein DL98DRAFT_598571 [Cadophora sp. DSE1049]